MICRKFHRRRGPKVRTVNFYDSEGIINHDDFVERINTSLETTVEYKVGYNEINNKKYSYLEFTDVGNSTWNLHNIPSSIFNRGRYDEPQVTTPDDVSFSMVITSTSNKLYYKIIFIPSSMTILNETNSKTSIINEGEIYIHELIHKLERDLDLELSYNVSNEDKLVFNITEGETIILSGLSTSIFVRETVTLTPTENIIKFIDYGNPGINIYPTTLNNIIINDSLSIQTTDDSNNNITSQIQGGYQIQYNDVLLDPWHGFRSESHVNQDTYTTYDRRYTNTMLDSNHGWHPPGTWKNLGQVYYATIDLGDIYNVSGFVTRPTPGNYAYRGRVTRYLIEYSEYDNDSSYNFITKLPQMTTILIPLPIINFQDIVVAV